MFVQGGLLMSSLSIKGTMRGLVICIEGNPLFENIKSELAHKLESRKGFFKAASFCLEGGSNLEEEQRQTLISMCLDNGMVHDDTISTLVREERKSARRTHNDAGDSDNVVINKNIRSGQKIVAKKDLVVVGNVNPGESLLPGAISL
jgi:septum formation inhibitor MinC